MNTLIIEKPVIITNKNEDYTQIGADITLKINQQPILVIHLYYKIFDSKIIPDDSCDAFLIASLMLAMKNNAKIIIKGDVSHSLLFNIIEYQQVWNSYYPELYSIIPIKADNIITQPAAESYESVCAFSGGLDAMFSVYSHQKKLRSYRSLKINRAVLIHGFDIPLNETTAFHNTKIKNTETLRDININLVTIETNFREAIQLNWEHVHGCALASVFHHFSRIANSAIIASGGTYDRIVPWGSNCILDPLLSSNKMVIINDGYGYNRSEKAKIISKWDIGSKAVRVCWQNQELDKNCGRCEKCLRTRLNFLYSTNSIPNAFPDTDLYNDIKCLKLDYFMVKRWSILNKYGKSQINNFVENKYIIKIIKLIDKKILISKIRIKFESFL